MGWSKWLFLGVWSERSEVRISKARSKQKKFKNFDTVIGPVFGLLGRLGWAALAGRFGLVNGLKWAGFINGSGLKNSVQPAFATITSFGLDGLFNGPGLPGLLQSRVGNQTGLRARPKFAALLLSL